MLLLEDKFSKAFADMEIDTELSVGSDSEELYGEDTILEAICDNIKHFDYDCDLGASKYVIVPEHCNFVLKFALQGNMYETFSYYDDELDEEIDLDEPEYEFEPWCVDYCAKEVDVYENAVAANLGFLFAREWVMGYDRNGTPIYAQEKIESFGEGNSSNADSVKTAEKMLGSDDHRYNRLSEKWLGAVIERYGEVTAEALLTFLDDQNVNDLHDGNVGFRKDGSPVLVDYSGFYS